MNLPKRKIRKVEIDGIGEICIKEPSAALSVRLQTVKGENETEKYLRFVAEALVDCLVNEDGTPMFISAQKALDELSQSAFNAISLEIMKEFPFSASGDAEKNSETIPDSSTPTN